MIITYIMNKLQPQLQTSHLRSTDVASQVQTLHRKYRRCIASTDVASQVQTLHRRSTDVASQRL